MATLVLQHVETEACVAYLKDFARLAPLAYVLTRVRSDFDANVLQLIADTQRFDAGVCVEVDHDPATHQLRVLGRETFDTLRQAADGVTMRWCCGRECDRFALLTENDGVNGFDTKARSQTETHGGCPAVSLLARRLKAGVGSGRGIGITSTPERVECS